MRHAYVTFGSDDINTDDVLDVLSAAGIEVIEVVNADAHLSEEEAGSSPFRIVDGTDDSFVVVKVDWLGREVWRASMQWPDKQGAKAHWRSLTATWARGAAEHGDAEVIPLRSPTAAHDERSKKAEQRDRDAELRDRAADVRDHVAEGRDTDPATHLDRVESKVDRIDARSDRADAKADREQ